MFVLSICFAQEGGFVQEDAHEHGAALLNVAQEGEALFVEFISPSVNIVGFEYAPSTDEEKALVDTAVSDLSEGLTLLSPDNAANCELLSAEVESEITDEHEEGEHKESEDAENEHSEDEEEHEEGEHEEEGEIHSEFHASYEFSCANPDALSGFDLSGLFALYPGLLDLDVQYALANGQGAAELNPENPRLDF